ncbi:PREDICTED: uncharacterized protein LOC109226305 [Nicotiana attenuata]|uniref:Uncharacterized protein n=1 Tax=Nicotiana attenuata TaxID=49451 RepID=A0A1J6J813_NICAT|nr:PREDICTED: uncharacterized protein LOC109226305 [Nicotiana attenuata]OIT03329.1 hypothetical protein A4A49_28536 [Nicotiana attenuata]
MQKDHFHTLDPFLESRNEHNQDSKLSKLQPWNEQRQEESDDIEFQACEHITNGYTPCSPPLWTQRALKDNTKNQSSTLLPCYDYFGHPFPGSRLQAIRDGRKHLMRMIQDLPESSFELSLKDIVDNQPSTEEDQQAETLKGRNPKVRMPQQSKTLKRSQISRSESMDSGVFLLKMFLPSSIGNKKKLKPKNCSKVSPKTPVDETEKSMNRDWWRIIYVVIKENKYSRSIKKSMSYNSSSKSRLVESNCIQRKQRGCFFLV